MDGNEFLDLADQEGWEFILVEFDPSDLADEALTEAIWDLQDSYRTVVSIASDSGLYERDEDDDSVEELDFDFD